MPQPRSLGHRGYTMIEMATTLVVAGIVTTMGILILSPAVEHAKVRSAANVVAGDLLGPTSDFALDQFSATGSSVELFPNGVAGSSITLTLGLRGFQRQVRLTRAGQIRIIQTAPCRFAASYTPKMSSPRSPT